MPSLFRPAARRLIPTVLAAVLAMPAVAASATPIRIFAAGSLSDAMTALMAASEQSADAFAKPVFGPSGLLARRILEGEAADLLFSADLAAPERVAAAHEGVLVVPFARNRMCVAAKPSVDLTEGNILDKMLSPDLRLATSTPVNDPGGDYALAVFKRAEALHSGAGKILADKALHLVGGPDTMAPIAGHSPSATIFLGDHADLFLYYCSSSGNLLREVPNPYQSARPGIA